MTISITRLWGRMTGRTATLVKKAQLAETSEKYRSAARFYRDALRYDRNLKIALNGLKRCRLRQTALSQAMPLIQEATRLQERNALHEALQKYRQAFDIYDGEKIRRQISTLETLLLSDHDELIQQAEEAEERDAFSEAKSYYRLALQTSNDDPAIREAIDRCTDNQVLVDKARIHVENGDDYYASGAIVQALQEYESALKTWPADETRRKVENAKREIEFRTRFLKGIDAEENGAIEAAWEIYSELAKTNKSLDVRLRVAICETRLGNFQKAIRLFERIPLRRLDKESLYYFGYSLLAEGQVDEGISKWRSLDAPEIRESLEKLEEYRDALADEALEQIQQLALTEQRFSEALELAKSRLQTRRDERIERLIPYLREKAIGELADLGRFEDLLKLIDNGPWGLLQRTNALLNLSAEDPKYLRPAVAYGISMALSDEVHSVVRDQVSWPGADEISQEQVVEAIQQHIVSVIQDGIASHSRLNASLIDVFNYEIEITRKLKGLRLDCPVMSPTLATILNERQEILDTLEARLSQIDDDEREGVLEVGAAYSASSQAFRLLLSGELEAALKTCSDSADPFVQYVAARVHYEMALNRIESDPEEALPFLELAHQYALLNSAKQLQLVEAINQSVSAFLDDDELERAKSVVDASVESGWSEMKKTSSTILNREAVQGFDAELLSHDETIEMLREALEIDPDNDQARENLNTVLGIREFPRVREALENGDLDSAVDIARKAESQSVKDAVVDLLFETIAKNVNDWQQLPPMSRISEAELSRLLEDWAAMARSIDASHPMVVRWDNR